MIEVKLKNIEILDEKRTFNKTSFISGFFFCFFLFSCVVLCCVVLFFCFVLFLENKIK